MNNMITHPLGRTWKLVFSTSNEWVHGNISPISFQIDHHHRCVHPPGCWDFRKLGSRFRPRGVEVSSVQRFGHGRGGGALFAELFVMGELN